MSDTTVQLGDIVFGRFEVPEAIPFGGEQSLVVHKLVGGTRIIDVMGEDPAPLEWSGWFAGQDALDRALTLDQMRKAGLPQVLTWSALRYTVIVRSVRCDFVRAYRIPYRITCEVVSDDIAPIGQSTDPSAEQLIADDMTTATGLASSIGDGRLSGLMGTLTSAISDVGSLATAAQSQINTILLPIAVARERVGELVQSADATLSGYATVGGIVPNSLLPQQVSALADQLTATTALPQLVQLDRTLGRVHNNIASVNGGTRSVTQAGGNLFSIASEQYDDATMWSSIAVANGLTDPWLSGINALTLPARISTVLALNAPLAEG